MDIRICFHDTKGLYNDAMVLKKAIETKYTNSNITLHTYPELCIYRNIIHPTIGTTKKQNYQFFIEHIHQGLLTYGNMNIFVPNIEFISTNDINLLSSINMIVAKTEHSYNVLTKIHPTSDIEYWGWTSLDRFEYDSNRNLNEFLHVKGCSRFKNTQLLIDLWLKHPEWPLLNVMNYGDVRQNGYVELNVPYVKVVSNIRLFQRDVPETELSTIMNRCGVHVCPSEQEGFGHYINEGRSCGAIIVTTNAKPMNELVDDTNGVLIDVHRLKSINYGLNATIHEHELESSIKKILQMSKKEKYEKSEGSRKKFEKENQLFNNRVQLPI
jgi:glycosyltransferase involved in cell wall biosynthesis